MAAPRSLKWTIGKARGAKRRLGRPHPAPPVEQSAGPGHDLLNAPERFDRHWYLLNNPDVAAVGVDPWTHYVQHGRFEGRTPHALFDRAWYAERYADVLTSDTDPFLDWATGSGRQRDPNEFFDTEWYLSRHPEVGAAGLDPVEHYRIHGWREGRRPSPLFDPTWYRGMYKDVAATDIDPLTHYLRFGRGEGRHANHLEHTKASGWYRPPEGLIPWFSPVNFALDDGLADHPHLNVLLPGMGVRHLTGGPNTAIQVAYRIAAGGRRVRFIATDAPLDDETTALWDHMASISGVGRRLANVEVLDGSNRHRAVHIGENDLFMATAWWTAQSVKAALPLVRQQRFVYLIQDFEPLFFASSSQYALAVETYGLDHVPVVNSKFLLDHLAAEAVGRFAESDFVEAALVFEPTVDRTFFRPAVPTALRTRKKLLFYARPVNGLRNLFEMGVAAMQLAVQQGVLDEAEWEFWGMGESFDPVAVGPRTVLRPLPWKDFAGYAEQMRQSDVLLSLMLAPHPSYPPLEMAACGGVAVTTEFGPKTAGRLAAISGNIIGAAATIEGIAQGLADAADRLGDTGARLEAASLALPRTWDDVFKGLLPRLEEELDKLERAPTSASARAESKPADEYTRWRTRRIHERLSEYPTPELPDDVTFSLMTAVWNTPGQYLRALGDSILSQDVGRGWEWVVVDNGSTDTETLAVLEELITDPRVRLRREVANLGILGGMRAALEVAEGRYVLHVDHDDLLTTDALRVAAASLAAHGWPEAFYTDEDKVQDNRFSEPYFKPDWDPVLFANSCYIAHLCGVDRQRAIALDAYLDPTTEASPDWDLFTRFSNAGVVPHHVDEIVYSWRIHATSTAGNPAAKPYALATHRRVLERLIEARVDAKRFTVEVHPDSPDDLDLWIRRRPIDGRPLVTVVLGEQPSRLRPLEGVDHEIRSVAPADVERFGEIVETACAKGALVHLLNPSAEILRDEWYWEAVGLFEMHPRVVVVGGPTVHDGRILSAADVAGFGTSGWASPESGEPADARGWFGYILKQRTVDGVAGDHAVFHANFLRTALAAKPSECGLRAVSAFCCLEAQRTGQRVVYSPMMRADVESPFIDAWDDIEQALVARHAGSVATSRWRSRFLSLEAERPFRANTVAERNAQLRALVARHVPPSVTYHDWLLEHLHTRADRYPTPVAPPSVSIITPVYSGTDPALFGELAASLRSQTTGVCEWVIGMDGEVGDTLQSVIEGIAADAVFPVLTTGGTKGGILRTMQSCLGVCSGDYVVPVDADDLLTPDALAILTSVAASRGMPDLIHSDEDVLDGERFRDPFLRPDWDPALHAAGSYVWHALCIKRSTAIEVGLYSDPAFEWCHDWDTVERIRRISGRIVHVAEVLYHWRRHSGSSTNTERPEAAQQDSVRAMFARMAADTEHPSRYEVTEFPLWRGATEFHLRRTLVDAPAITLVSLGTMSDACRTSLVTDAPPLDGTILGPGTARPAGELIDVLERVDSDLVLLVQGDMLVADSDPVWEAVKWFELLPDTAAVCGRLLAPNGSIILGADLGDSCADGAVFHPIAGRQAGDPGPYALALKPHSIDVFDPRLALVDRRLLLGALRSIDSVMSIESSGTALGTSLRDGGARIVYSPLLMALAPNVQMPQISDAVDPSPMGLGPISRSRTLFR